jgi:predicted PurR-regulated permease PerM
MRHLIGPRVVAQVILTAIAILAALYFLYLVRNVLGLLLIAVFLAVALGRPVGFLTHRGVPRAAAILLVYLAIFLAVFGVGLVMVPPVVEGADELVSSVPGYVAELRESETIRAYDDRYGITERLEGQLASLPQRLVGALSALQGVTVGVFSTLFQLVTILVMSFILLLDGSFFTDFFFRQLGPARERRARMVAQNVYVAVGGYVAGAFAVALMAGLSTFVALSVIGVPYAIPLAVLMAFFDLIPLIGATIAGLLIAVVAAFDNFPTSLIAWAIFLVVYQQVENNLVQPFVQRRAVALHPLLVIVAVLMGATLLGVLGALLAIPAAASIQILLKEYWHFREAPPEAGPADQRGQGVDPSVAPESGEEARGEGGQPEQPGARVHPEHRADL